MSHITARAVDALQAAEGVRYVSAAGFVILLYDIFLTLGDEINLIWRAEWSLPKALFLFNRYSVPGALLANEYMMAGFASPATNAFCVRFSLGLAVVQLFEAVGVIPLMLVLRVYALYNRSWRVLIGLVALACLGVSTCLTLVVYGISADASQVVFLSDEKMCSFVGMTPYLWAVWLVLNLYELSFESLIFVLIICRTWKSARMQTRVPLLYALLRDGVAYFGVMLLLLIIDLLAYTVFPPALGLVGVYFTWSLHATLISRIYLNLRNVTNPRDWAVTTALREPAAPAPVIPPVIDIRPSYSCLSLYGEEPPSVIPPVPPIQQSPSYVSFGEEAYELTPYAF